MDFPNIPGYTIRRELGEGGMAAVYLARQESLKREVALKLLTPAMKRHSHQDHYIERFNRERITVAGLSHRNIVTVHDSGVSDGCYYLVMELLTGGTLEERLEESGKLAPSEALGIVRPLADALHYAHAKGLVHRDIKPLNIMFREDGTPVLTDFGIVKLLEDSGGLTKGMTIGSAQYMSPEQTQGHSLDGRSDLYSLGVVLYRMLTGELPFYADNPVTLAYLHVNNPIPRLPSSLVRFQFLIDKLMAKSPEERYADAAALIVALDDLLKTEQARSEAASKATLAMPGTLELGTQSSGPAEQAVRLSARGKWPVALVVLLAVGLGVGGYYALKQIVDIEPEMIEIPAGSFLMGSPTNEINRGKDEQQHRVDVAAFAIGKYEVTFDEYDRFAEATGRDKPDDKGWGRGKRPVINVSWEDAVAYAEWLSKQTGERYRLPTEAEWEYAARADTSTPFHFGETITPEQANYNGNEVYGQGRTGGTYRKKTTPVGEFPANAWGLHDVHGNVWEWTCSKYEKDYDGSEMSCIDNSNTNSSAVRVLRGGSWDNYPGWVRSAGRSRFGRSHRNYGIGFRLARTFVK